MDPGVGRDRACLLSGVVICALTIPSASGDDERYCRAVRSTDSFRSHEHGVYPTVLRTEDVLPAGDSTFTRRREQIRRPTRHPLLYQGAEGVLMPEPIPNTGPGQRHHRSLAPGNDVRIHNRYMRCKFPEPLPEYTPPRHLCRLWHCRGVGSHPSGRCCRPPQSASAVRCQGAQRFSARGPRRILSSPKRRDNFCPSSACSAPLARLSQAVRRKSYAPCVTGVTRMGGGRRCPEVRNGAGGADCRSNRRYIHLPCVCFPLLACLR